MVHPYLRHGIRGVMWYQGTYIEFPVAADLFTRLGPIQPFWFTEPDTEPNWVVLLVCHLALCRYILTLKIGLIQQFWFADPDTEPNWVVCLVRHDTPCRFVLTLPLYR